MRSTPFSTRRSRTKSAVCLAIGWALPGTPSTKTRQPNQVWGNRQLRTQHGAARACEESHVEQERHDLRLADRLAVEPFDREALRAALLDVFDECAEGDAEPSFLGIAQRNERAPAALDEQRRLAAEQDDVRAGDTCRTGARTLWPRDCGAVGLRRVGRRKDERLRLLVLLRLELSQTLHGPRERELRAAEALDEVAAAADAERFQRA